MYPNIACYTLHMLLHLFHFCINFVCIFSIYLTLLMWSLTEFNNNQDNSIADKL